MLTAAFVLQQKAPTFSMNLAHPPVYLCLLMTLGIIRPSSSVRPGHTCPVKWSEDYTRHHQAISDGTVAPKDRRYAISISSPSGIADRLAGCITVFYYALLTGRAFLEHTAMPGQIPFEAAYSSPHIDWRTTEHHSKLLPSHRPGEVGLPNTKGDSFQHYNILNPEFDSSRGDIFRIFSHGNLSNLGIDKDIVFITTNRATSVRLFENPYHGQQLRKIGLTPETAFGCAIHFLFKPLPEVVKLLIPTMHLLAQRPSIGIHLRVGDHAFQESHVAQVEEFANYFDCAKEVEQAFFVKAEDVVWLLLSDSKDLRRQASEFYGDKVHILSTDNVEHSYGMQVDAPRASLDSFRAAVSEHWVMGFTDVHIVDKDSGFGLTAAMRTYETNHIFVLGHGEKKQCQRRNAAFLLDIGIVRAGIK